MLGNIKKDQGELFKVQQVTLYWSLRGVTVFVTPRKVLLRRLEGPSRRVNKFEFLK